MAAPVQVNMYRDFPSLYVGQQLTANLGSPYWTSDNGPMTYTASSLPAGITMSSSGILSGTITTVGPGSTAITATNASGSTVGNTFTWFVRPASGVTIIATLNDAILAVTGGPTVNEGLMSYYILHGAVGNTLNELERSFLAPRTIGDDNGPLNDMWVRYLDTKGYNGTLMDMLLQWWRQSAPP